MCSKAFLAPAFALLTISVSMAANAAAPENEEPQTIVSYRDLNLASTEGAETLQRRVRHAAKSVCDRSATNWQEKIEERNCERKAVAAAQPQVDMALRMAGRAYAMTNGDKGIVVR